MRHFVGTVAVLLCVTAPIWAQGGAAGQGRAQRPPQNLKVLSPTTNLRAEMQRISDSLGVKCDFCHVQGNFPSDEKKEKLTARKMMQMVKTINATNFPTATPKEGDSPLGSAVTCYTCHHGEEHPATVPPKGSATGF